MRTFRIIYENGHTELVYAKTVFEVDSESCAMHNKAILIALSALRPISFIDSKQTRYESRIPRSIGNEKFVVCRPVY